MISVQAVAEEKARVLTHGPSDGPAGCPPRSDQLGGDDLEMPVYRQRRLGVKVGEAARREGDEVFAEARVDCSGSSSLFCSREGALSCWSTPRRAQNAKDR